MKFGFRKPNIKKSIKARTTGKLKRMAKSTINPFYNKKGIGFINNPKKAIYNKVYNKTTFGISDILKSFKNKEIKNMNNNSKEKTESTNIKLKKKKINISTLIIIFLIILLIGAASTNSESYVAELTKTNDELGLQIENLTTENNNLKQKVNNKESEIESLKIELNDKNIKLNDLDKQINNLNSEKNTLNAKINDLESQIANSKKQVSTSSTPTISDIAQSTNTSEMVWVGNTGTKYHKQSCRTLKGNGHQITLQQAQQENREKCKVCY